ncbi:hypothetical protein Bca52824_078267 [Brassica carinata]|uniref:Uncharacterized protein n=1 Tax=Brassica carinata TaxID=52824 RepID=A0A8X7PXB7_BRACI|nr:hypothetical protein Bca52824_078267 [Brassica carinata]
MEHGTTNNTMDQSPNKKYPLRKKRHAAHHVSDRPAINEHASERAPSASTGTREGRVGSPPTAKSKQRKPFNQSGLPRFRQGGSRRIAKQRRYNNRLQSIETL